MRLVVRGQRHRQLQHALQAGAAGRIVARRPHRRVQRRHQPGRAAQLVRHARRDVAEFVAEERAVVAGAHEKLLGDEIQLAVDRLHVEVHRLGNHQHGPLGIGRVLRAGADVARAVVAAAPQARAVLVLVPEAQFHLEARADPLVACETDRLALHLEVEVLTRPRGDQHHGRGGGACAQHARVDGADLAVDELAVVEPDPPVALPLVHEADVARVQAEIAAAQRCPGSGGVVAPHVVDVEEKIGVVLTQPVVLAPDRAVARGSGGDPAAQ